MEPQLLHLGNSYTPGSDWNDLSHGLGHGWDMVVLGEGFSIFWRWKGCEALWSEDVLWGLYFPMMTTTIFIFLQCDLDISSIAAGSMFLFFGHAVQHVRSQLPDQGLNPCHLHGKHRVLATGPAEKSQCPLSLNLGRLMTTEEMRLDHMWWYSVLPCSLGILVLKSRHFALKPKKPQGEARIAIPAK